MMRNRKKIRISIRYKIWLSILATVAFIVAVLWVMQVLLLDDSYIHMKKDTLTLQTHKVMELVKKNGALSSQKQLYNIALENTFCIDISTNSGNSVITYEGLGDNCYFHQNEFNRLDVLARIVKQDEVMFYDVNHPNNNTRYFISGAVVNYGEQSYIITISTTLSSMKEASSIIQGQLLNILFILFIVSLATAFLVSKSITKPILRISSVARQVASGNFAVSLPISTNDEIGELSENFNYMIKEINRVTLLQKELVANISHDIRTPLTMIKGYAEAIKDITGNNVEKREQQLLIIIDEVDRLNNLVNNVLDLSLMQAGQVDFKIKPFCITEKIRDIIGRFSLLEQTQNFEFVFNAEDNLITLGDEIRIEQVLYNLISNAVNHIGEVKRITITQKISQKGCIIEISDTGKGIEKDDLPLIWDRYYKPYKNGEKATSGAGLGLSIVKAILINHNSSFGVKSTLNVGSTFWFELNVQKKEKLQIPNKS